MEELALSIILIIFLGGTVFGVLLTMIALALLGGDL